MEPEEHPQGSTDSLNLQTGEIDLDFGSDGNGSISPSLRVFISSAISDSDICLPQSVETGSDSESDFGPWCGWMDNRGRWSLHVRSGRYGDGIQLDCRLLNRTNETLEWDGGLTFLGSTLALTKGTGGALLAIKEGTLILRSDGTDWGSPKSKLGGMVLPFLNSSRCLEPRECLEFELDIVFAPVQIRNLEVHSGLMIATHSEGFILYPSEAHEDVTVSILDPSGKEISATFAFLPGVGIAVEHAHIGGNPQKLAAVSAGGVVLGSFDFTDTEARFIDGGLLRCGNAGQQINSSGNNRVREAALAVERAFQVQDWPRAALFAEQELLFNGNDALAWWEMAVAQRHSEVSQSDALSNAHFLAPLDLVLRAEAVLNGEWRGRETHPLLNAIKDQPELMVLAVIPYIERGLWKDAANWLNECLRTCDSPRLHLLAAYTYLNGTSMRTHAAEHFQQSQSGKSIVWITDIENIAQKTLTNEFLS